MLRLLHSLGDSDAWVHPSRPVVRKASDQSLRTAKACEAYLSAHSDG
jgi:hypothetical protein